MTPELALASRNAEIERFYNDTLFQYALTHALWEYDADALYGHNLRQEGRSATAAGVLRAWMLRFLSERGYEQSFPRGRDITHDYQTVLGEYPELATFTPATPLTNREVLLATRIEVNHSIVLYERKWSSDIYRSLYQDDYELSPSFLGPVTLAVASRLLTEVGLTTTSLWIFARCIFDNEIQTTARGLCGYELSKTEHQRLRRTLLALDDRVRGFTAGKLEGLL
jgi:hypothetical protein